MIKLFRFGAFVHLLPLLLLLAAPSSAQSPAAPTADSADVEVLPETPVFSVTTVAKTTQAVNYRYRRSDTKVDFKGSSLNPLARGEAEVQAKRGYTEIKADFTGLKEPNSFSAEYLTYVLWAVTPQGRAVNLGEIVIDDRGRGKLEVTSELQEFGMVVTAEPYFAVRRPSDLVVAENEIREDTKGEVRLIDARYELLRRGEYAKLTNPLALDLDLKRNTLDIYQARNAVMIAKGLHAEQYAEEIIGRADESLKKAEDLTRRRADKKDISTAARQAVQIAEDARELAEKRAAEERLANERQAAAEREAQANATAEEEARMRAEAEAQQRQEAELRARADQAKDAAERKSLEAELAAAKARAEMEKALREKEQAQRMIDQAKLEVARAAQERESAMAAVRQIQAERERLEAAKLEAEQSASQAFSEKEASEERSALAQAAADAARLQSEQAMTAAEESRAAAAQAQAEREQLAIAKAEAEAAAASATAEKEEALQLIAQAKAETEAAQRERQMALMAKAEAESAVEKTREEARRLEQLRAAAQSEAERARSESEEMRNRMQEALGKVVETQETARGLVLNLPDILFDFGKSTLRPEAREVISRIAGIMMVTPGYSLRIEGHTDSVGSDEFNQKLSEARAGGVQNYLAEAKINSGLLSTVGFGKTRPVASNDTDAGRQKNRRVEILVQDAQQKSQND